MGYKRGQVSAFIIGGILVLFVVGLIIYFMSQSPGLRLKATTSTEMDHKAMQITPYVEQCLKTTAVAGISMVGRQGGYLFPPIDSVITADGTRAFYYYRGDELVPSIPLIQHELDLFVQTYLPYCLNDFNAFKEQGWDITTGTIASRASISPTAVSIDLDYPVTVKDKDYQKTFTTFSISLPSKFGTLYEVSKEKVQDTKEEPLKVLMGKNLDLMGRYDVQIDSASYGDDIVIYHIQDLLTSNPSELAFAVKIDRSNHAPAIRAAEEYTLAAGQEQVIRIGVSDPEDDPLMVSVDPNNYQYNMYTGEIRFTPPYRDVGMRTLTITASDGMLETQKEIRLLISDQNEAPTITVEEIPALTEQEAHYPVKASDYDSTILHYSTTSDLVTVDEHTGIVTAIPHHGGKQPFDITVTDAGGAYKTETFTLDVTDQ